jgi:hypothetical protein
MTVSRIPAYRITGLIGANSPFYYKKYESLAVSSTTSQTAQNKLDQTTDTLGAGTYRIYWSVEYTTSNSNKTMEILVLVDDVSQYTSGSTAVFGANNYQYLSGTFNVVLSSSGTKNFKIQYRCVDTSMTSYIRNVILDIQKFTES